MIIVTTEGQRREFPEATRLVTEEVFNNLCLHNAQDDLLVVFAQDRWISAEVVDDDS
jgi:hypothetical protein